jgi:hypothetical protein
MLKKTLLVAIVPAMFACGSQPAAKKDAATEMASEDAGNADGNVGEDLAAPVITKKTYKAVYNSDGTKMEAVYNLPVVGDENPSLKKALSDQAILGESIAKTVKNFKECGCGTISADYEVTYLSPEAVSIVLTTEVMGAYSSVNTIYQTLDASTGNPLALKNELTAEGLKWMMKAYKKELLARGKNARQEQGIDDASEDVADLVRQFNEGIGQLTLESVSYVFTKTGITLTSEGIFPHFAASMEPDHAMEFSYESLRPYATSSGVVIEPITD